MRHEGKQVSKARGQASQAQHMALGEPACGVASVKVVCWARHLSKPHPKCRFGNSWTAARVEEAGEIGQLSNLAALSLELSPFQWGP